MGGNERYSKTLRLRALEEKRERQDQKGEAERRAMERKANVKFNIHFIEWFNPRMHQGFIVNLRKPLSEAEIQARMAKAFGDL